ncbi:unnamed protein product [Arabidopsis arenosa]|uniref:protein-synthesizing GTPase n=1 Tax=Arabidopsis arenosa TaxID=38785 RepID=A0A8S2ARI8_ARAAE|nr:unnamed protein product [Arabidopsis arenosa]
MDLRITLKYGGWRSRHHGDNVGVRDSWGSLPQELLRTSTNLLNPNFAEYDKLRGVNSHWRGTFPSFRDGSFREERPWLLYREIGSGETRFYDPVRESLHYRKDPNLEGAKFLGSTLGWVVMSDSIAIHPRQHHQTFLYNPFTSQRYQLPVLTIGNQYRDSVIRYGVLTGDPREDNTYACLLADSFSDNNLMDTPHGHVLDLQIYYVAKRNGEWDQNWSVTHIPTSDHHIYNSAIQAISPSADKISILLRVRHTFDFTFQTQEWNVSKTQENDPIEWNPFHGQSFDQMKDRLQISPQTLAIIGTKTDRERVRNNRWGAYDGQSVSYIDGVWVEVISRQATINIGTIGHVAHGKSTIVKAISGVQTVRFKNELECNITIKLGYANAKIYKCEDDKCPRPMCYNGKEDNPNCDVPGFEKCKMKLLRHVLFVDCPGHDILMATMLNGAAIMDGALLLIAANETCPQPQTAEHLASNTNAEDAPIVPVSAQLKYNIDVVSEYIVKKIPIPVRDFVSPPKMIVIRSFDVNKPGSAGHEMKGGVAGGSILQGVLKVNQLIEIRPGITGKDELGNSKCTPIYSRITSLYAEQNELQFAVPGGLIGVGTTMDPTLTRADRLVGQVLGEMGSLPDVFVELEVSYQLLTRLIGVRTKEREKQMKVSKLTKEEILMVNIGSMSTGAKVIGVKKDMVKLQLTSPVCTTIGEKVALSRRVDRHWRLIGKGQILAGTTIDVPPPPF